ncbi:receptor-like protein 35 [Malus domestica]|uniref:receptor-like protein 35 n=1 Tax=Malus domestica TaxID=3750 RepID=UPI0010AAEA41|nr:probable LRR receptor-like serine/threonine-protein kinase At1g34110 [Malus domestica]
MLFLNLTEICELYLDGINISAQGTQWCQALSSSLLHLRVLSMSGSQLSGPFCQSFAKLQSLSVIQLDNNDISGPIPGFFAKFTNLTVLSLNNNNIAAMVPRLFANFSKLTALSLQNCNLNGTLPKEIFQVPTLQTVDLSHNLQLHGSLPEFPENASLQFLDLSFTKVSGLLPDSIGNLKMLSFLNLFNCSFSGSIPKSMASLTELVYLDMSSNMFNGSIDSIYWGNHVSLQSLFLESNLLTGTIPSSIFSPPPLLVLTLSHNRFSGQLHECSNVSSQLSLLDLSSNNLEGPIPASISNFQELAYLRLSSNHFNSFPSNGHPCQFEELYLAFNNLRAVPDILRYQTSIRRLDLSGNQIQKVPNWFWSLHLLDYLNLSSNYLVTLAVPFNYTKEFSTLDLHSNQLKGSIPLLHANYLDYSSNHFTSIPTNIGDFLNPSTKFLSISSNDLHGLIPSSICNVIPLVILDLSIISLSGTIPQCLSAMSHLEVLNLRRNNLTGSISDFKFFEDCDLVSLELNQNQLHGQFPKSLAKCSNLQVVNLGNN